MGGRLQAAHRKALSGALVEGGREGPSAVPGVGDPACAVVLQAEVSPPHHTQ